MTCESNYEKLNKILEGRSVGICILSDRNTLRFVKEPIENNVNLSYEALFKVLHKKEFEEILLDFYGELPKATPVFFYDECLDWFSKISMDILYPLFLKQLKKRNQIIKEYYQNVPYELKSLLYFYNAKENDYLKLERFLSDKYRG